MIQSLRLRKSKENLSFESYQSSIEDDNQEKEAQGRKCKKVTRNILLVIISICSILAITILIILLTGPTNASEVVKGFFAGQLSYNVECAEMQKFYRLEFKVNAAIIPGTSTVEYSSTSTIACTIEAEAGGNYIDRVQNDYKCLGRCGPGCSNLPTWLDTSTWTLDCLTHDICSYFFAGENGSSTLLCTDPLLKAADDLVLSSCAKSSDDIKEALGKEKTVAAVLICDGHEILPGGIIK